MVKELVNEKGGGKMRRKRRRKSEIERGKEKGKKTEGWKGEVVRG